jgi:hypothetical protein
MAIALIGSEISVNSSTAGFQETLDIVGLKAPEGQAGGFVIVWEDDLGGSFEEVRAQISPIPAHRLAPKFRSTKPRPTIKASQP